MNEEGQKEKATRRLDKSVCQARIHTSPVLTGRRPFGRRVISKTIIPPFMKHL